MFVTTKEHGEGPHKTCAASCTLGHSTNRTRDLIRAAVRLLEAIGQGRCEPINQSVTDLLGKIARWHGSARPQDDISILAVEVALARGG